LSPTTPTEGDFGHGTSLYTLAQVPGTPSYIGNATGTVTFTFSESGNGANVQYAIYSQYSSDGTTWSNSGYYKNSDGTINNAGEDWKTFDELGVIAATGLTQGVGYKFKVKARNEEGTETAFSSYSVTMMSEITLDYGPLSSAYTLEVTTGNTKIGSISASASYGDITITYSLINKASSTSSITIKYKVESGGTYTTCTERAGGASQGVTGLTSSSAGTTHTFIWNSCADLGNSYNSETIYIEIVPYDGAGSGVTPSGDAGEADDLTGYTIDNRPSSITIAEYNGYTYDKDTTPVFVSEMGSVRCGSSLYFIITAYDSSMNIVQENSSAEILTGWEYEKVYGESWFSVPPSGVDVAYTGADQRIRYTFQTGLTQGATYTFKIRQAETQHRLV
jgi:hypothetical protein